MDSNLFFKGALIGFAIAAPVGPIGVLCIRRSLADGRVFGFLSGLGAAAADAVYGAVAAFGLTIISGFLIEQQMWLRLLGGLYLSALGIRTYFAKSEPQEISEAGGTRLGAFASTFVLTLTNPLTILSFAAIYTGLGLAGQSSNLAAAQLVLGVFCGSAGWWFLLSFGASLFSSRLTARGLLWINRISGLIIAGFGVVALLTLFRH